MTIRDLTKYRWKKDFHKHIWELMKRQNPKIPNYTWGQIIAAGWRLEIHMQPKNRNIELINDKRGITSRIPISIDNHPMPHASNLLGLIPGFPTAKQGGATPAIREELYNHWINISPRMKAEGSLNTGRNFDRLTVNVGPSKTWVIDECFKEIYSAPLDNSYSNPEATTSERYVKNIIYMEKDTTLYM